MTKIAGTTSNPAVNKPSAPAPEPTAVSKPSTPKPTAQNSFSVSNPPQAQGIVPTPKKASLTRSIGVTATLASHGSTSLKGTVKANTKGDIGVGLGVTQNGGGVEGSVSTGGPTVGIGGTASPDRVGGNVSVGGVTVAAEVKGRGNVTSHAEATRTFANSGEAQRAFQAQANALVDVNNWSKLGGWENAGFDLYNASGQDVDRSQARVGDYVAIDLPGPSGTDWVRVESVQRDGDNISLTVRPSQDPTNPRTNPDGTPIIDHFFTSAATNTFSLQRNGNQITAAVHGRNESANTGAESGGTLASLRNRAVSEGAWGPQIDIPFTNQQLNGPQQHQWNRFTDNLVEINP